MGFTYEGQDILNEIERYLNASTPGPWVYGQSPTTDIDSMLAYLTDLVMKSPGTTLGLVCTEIPEHPDEPKIVALTGNGPNSDANARMITLARDAIPHLLTQNRWLRHTMESHLIPALQKTYRKHVQDDDRIGWQELGEVLLHALCEGMGDQGFQEWLASQEDERKSDGSLEYSSGAGGGGL